MRRKKPTKVDPRAASSRIAPDEGAARPKREEPAGGSESARCDTRLQALDGPQSHATEPTRMCAVCAMTQRDSNWPVTAVCLGCMWLCLLSITYLPAATHAQPHMRKPPERRRGEERDAGVSHVTPPAPLARVRTSRREAPHAPLRPAWPVSRRATLWHALAYLSALAARPAPRAAPRAAQRSMKRPQPFST
jgi:hypothetical protein